MKKDRFIQEYIEEERLQIENPEKGWVGFLLGAFLFLLVLKIIFSSLCHITLMPTKASETLSISDLIDLIIYGSIESFFKYLILPSLSFILSLVITFYIFDKLSNVFEKFKPKIERKRSNDDVLDAD